MKFWKLSNQDLYALDQILMLFYHTESCMRQSVQVNNCDYDLSGDMFGHFYGNVKPRVPVRAGGLAASFTCSSTETTGQGTLGL